MASAPIPYQKIYERRLARAIQRAKSGLIRPTSTLARDFFNDVARAPHDRYNNDAWRSLPRRLLKLVTYLQDPSSYSNGSSGDICDVDEARRRLAAAVFAQAPPSFSDDFRYLFEALLNERQNQWKRVNNADDSMDVDDSELENGGDDDLLQQEDQLYQSLAILGWVSSSQLRRPFREALHSVTMGVIDELVAGEFEDEGVLDRVLQWKNAVLIPWAYKVVGSEAFVQDQWERQLEYAASDCFVHVRMKELFDLVTEYPDSLPAVRELSVALDRTGRLWYQQLANEWRNALMTRLLHPGAETSQIIEVYINTIKVLREMDPSGELLQVVTQPVRDYLKGRSDTIRCIITSLTDEENGGDLYEELRRQDAKPLEEAQLDEEDEEEPPTFDWEPPPSILKRRGVITGQVGRVTSSSRRAGDILSMLVGIYGSKDLFVNEYRIMLADKLLGNMEYDTDKEVHNLELLKLRFGEVSMRQCEVMIKDIDDSKRIHTNIHSTLAQSNPSVNDAPVVDAAIVSHIFWPALQREEYKNHPRLASRLDQFSTEYAKLKNPRRLVWMKQLGMVELEVEAYEKDEDGNLTSHVKEVSCTPAHATLLAHFEDKGEWTSEELSNKTEMPEEMVRKRLGFWVNQRVIQSKRSGEDMIYSLISVSEADANDQSFQHDDEDQQQAVSLGAHEEEEMKVYESYIFGMLSNLGQLPLERIHSMLKTFVAGSDHKYDKTPQQLAVFLQQLCKEDKLECSPDGLYTILKKRS
ncbi:hypothetical protein ACHAXR_012103 [Thalassiosira sp. AJA248-18]